MALWKGSYLLSHSLTMQRRKNFYTYPPSLFNASCTLFLQDFVYTDLGYGYGHIGVLGSRTGAQAWLWNGRAS